MKYNKNNYRPYTVPELAEYIYLNGSVERDGVPGVRYEMEISVVPSGYSVLLHDTADDTNFDTEVSIEELFDKYVKFGEKPVGKLK